MQSNTTPGPGEWPKGTTRTLFSVTPDATEHKDKNWAKIKIKLSIKLSWGKCHQAVSECFYQELGRNWKGRAWIAGNTPCPFHMEGNRAPTYKITSRKTKESRLSQDANKNANMSYKYLHTEPCSLALPRFLPWAASSKVSYLRSVAATTGDC